MVPIAPAFVHVILLAVCTEHSALHQTTTGAYGPRLPSPDSLLFRRVLTFPIPRFWVSSWSSHFRVVRSENLPRHWSCLAAEQFTQLELAQKATGIFESFVDDSQAHHVAKTRKSNLRKDSKSSNWKLLYNSWVSSSGSRALLKSNLAPTFNLIL